MGITFRDGKYVRRVKLGKRTIKEGEFALVWNVNGRCTKYHGPRVVRMWFSTIRFCTRYIANEREYLEVNHKDGRTEHMPGPCTLHLDHLDHVSIKVRSAIEVKACECLAIYNERNEQSDFPFVEKHTKVDLDKHLKKSSKQPTQGEIKFGPCLFFPEVHQRIQTFPWSTTDPKILSLREQMSPITVTAKTKDNHKIALKFFFAYKVDKANIETLISATQNPFVDLSNAIKFDAAEHLSTRCHDDFVADNAPFQGASLQNPFSQSVFKNLHNITKDIGVIITQMHFEGYEVCSEILLERNAHARAEADMKARIEAAEEKERLNDFQLEKKMARAAKQAQSDVEEMLHRQNLIDKEHEAKLKRQLKEHKQRLEQKRESSLVKSEFFKHLGEQGVDLTKYLVAAVSSEKTTNKERTKQPNATIDHFEEEEWLMGM